MVYVFAFLFLCWFCFWRFLVLLLVCVVLFLVLISVYRKHCCPCSSGVVLSLKGSFMFYVFVLDFLFLVLFVCSLNNEVALFCVYVVCFRFCNKTMWFSGLHLVVLFFLLFCVQLLLFHSFQKYQKRTQQKQKTEMRKQIFKKQLAQLFSQIVFLIFGGGLQNCNVC